MYIYIYIYTYKAALNTQRTPGSSPSVIPRTDAPYGIISYFRLYYTVGTLSVPPQALGQASPHGISSPNHAVLPQQLDFRHPASTS